MGSVIETIMNDRIVSLDLSLILLEMMSRNVPESWRNYQIDWIVSQYTDDSWGIILSINGSDQIRSNVTFGDVFSAFAYLDKLEDLLKELVQNCNGKMISVDLN